MHDTDKCSSVALANSKGVHMAIRSIAGEQQNDVYFQMDEGDVDQYVANATDAVLRCRESGHRFEGIRRGVIDFVGVDNDGLLIRRLPCTQCGCAEREEHWEAYKSGRQTRFRCIARTLNYRTGPDGEQYVAPSGRGRMTRTQVRDAMMTQALGELSLSHVRRYAAKADERPR